MKVVDPFYKSKHWYRVRQKCLTRAGNRCEQCGYVGKGLSVHHIKPRKEYPMLALEMWNLICVCRSCHNSLHDRMNDTVIDKPKTSDDGFSSDEWR